MVAKRLVRHHTPVTTVDKLSHRVKAAWASVPVHTIQSLFDSIPRRINSVIILKQRQRFSHWTRKSRSAKEVSLSPKSRGCLAHARVFLSASDLNENKFPSEIIRGKVRKSRVIPPTPLGPPSVPTRAGCTPHESRAPPVTCEGSSAISHLRHPETFLAHPLPLRRVRETEFKRVEEQQSCLLLLSSIYQSHLSCRIGLSCL
ncbi:hypothetical protein TNCV_3628881 [Trichonephila clavipes]|nr:hypothetical protein TNCV_3628881 [Trichonephila clavipes]